MKAIVSILIVCLAASSSYCQEYVKGSNLFFEEMDSETKDDTLEEIYGGIPKDKTFAEFWARFSKIQQVHIYGGGSLFNAVSANEKVDDPNAVTGSIGINFSSYQAQCNLFFSYNGRQTVEMQSLSDYGNALINPNISGQALSFSALVKIVPNFGFSGKLRISDNLWRMADSSLYDASPLLGKLGFYFRPFDFDLPGEDNYLNIILDAHFTHRGILGDFNNGERAVEGKDIAKRGYNGFDASLNIYLNSLHMFVQYSSNLNTTHQIPGFTGDQVVIGLNVTGELLQLK